MEIPTNRFDFRLHVSIQIAGCCGRGRSKWEIGNSLRGTVIGERRFD
jgi:hypothetical protein